MPKKKVAKLKYKFPALTKEQRRIAGPILGSFENLCLLSGGYKGEPVGIICSTNVSRAEAESLPPGEELTLTPVFIVVTKAMQEHCTDSMGETPKLDKEA